MSFKWDYRKRNPNEQESEKVTRTMSKLRPLGPKRSGNMSLVFKDQKENSVSQQRHRATVHKPQEANSLLSLLISIWVNEREARKNIK